MRILAPTTTALLLAACLGENITLPDKSPPVTENPPAGENPAPTCASSALCLFENPDDTLTLTGTQRDTARLLPVSPAHQRVGVAVLNLADLGNDSLRLELFPGVVLTVASRGYRTSGVLTGSGDAYSSWTGTSMVSEDEGIILGSRIDLGFLNGNFVAGSAHIGGKDYTLVPLGDGTVMVFELKDGWKTCGVTGPTASSNYLGCPEAGTGGAFPLD